MFLYFLRQIILYYQILKLLLRKEIIEQNSDKNWQIKRLKKKFPFRWRRRGYVWRCRWTGWRRRRTWKWFNANGRILKYFYWIHKIALLKNNLLNVLRYYEKIIWYEFKIRMIQILFFFRYSSLTISIRIFSS